VITESTELREAITHMFCCSYGIYFSAAVSSKNDQGSMNLASRRRLCRFQLPDGDQFGRSPRRSFIGGSDARIIIGSDEAALVRLPVSHCTAYGAISMSMALGEDLRC
jgi:hypothetical protein